MGDDRSIALLEEIRDLLQQSITNQQQLLRSNAEAMGLYRPAAAALRDGARGGPAGRTVRHRDLRLVSPAPAARATEGTGRVDAFSDGVFAIAITLLILEVRAPHADAGAHLWTGLAKLWPSYLAFGLSFFVILIMWVNHHELMRLVRACTYPFLFANGFVLLTVTFVPFPTAVLAEHLATGEARAAVTFYCGTFVINSLAWGLLFRTIVRGGLLHSHVEADTIARIRRAYAAGPLVYIVATLVALVQPAVGLAVNASLWLLWIRLCYHTAAEARQGKAG